MSSDDPSLVVPADPLALAEAWVRAGRQVALATVLETWARRRVLSAAIW